jgi:hypothetical protein
MFPRTETRTLCVTPLLLPLSTPRLDVSWLEVLKRRQCSITGPESHLVQGVGHSQRHLFSERSIPPFSYFILIFYFRLPSSLSQFIYLLFHSLFFISFPSFSLLLHLLLPRSSSSCSFLHTSYTVHFLGSHVLFNTSEVKCAVFSSCRRMRWQLCTHTITLGRMIICNLTSSTDLLSVLYIF